MFMGRRNEKIGNIEDVIFDHETMEIRFAVIEGGDRSQSHKFLFPVNRSFDDNKHRDGFALGINKQNSEDFPGFAKSSLESKDSWKKYQDEFQKFWEQDPVMHRRGSDRILTPPREELRAGGNGSHKVTLHPRSARRAEEAAAGVARLKPRWDAFAGHLRRHRTEVQSHCAQWAQEGEKTSSAA